MRDILLGNVLENHIYEEEMEYRRLAETRLRDLLTKSSKPSSVPVNSRSFFMTTHMREPMHLSMSSVHPVYIDY
jgi:hypothetical protein